jgi:hypothetical protein
VELVDEQDDVVLGDSFITFLRRSSNSPRYSTRHERGQVERVDLLALEQLGHVVGRCGRRGLDDGGLADTRFPDQYRIVFVRRERICITLDLVWRPTTGSSLPSRRAWSGCGRTGRAASSLRLLAWRRPRPCRRRPGPESMRMISLRIFLGVGVEVEQDARRDALVLAHEAEQDVLVPM